MTVQTPDPTVPAPETAEATPPIHSVVATFPTPEAARLAAQALSVRSIPVEKISLTGPGDRPGGGWASSGTRLSQVSSTVASGAMVGGLVGGVGGLALGGFTAAVFNVDIGALALLAVGVFGAVGVGAIGGFMSGSTLDQPLPDSGLTAWPAIAVESSSQRELSSVVKVLRALRPLELYRDEERLT
jgi:hypothetical protein